MRHPWNRSLSLPQITATLILALLSAALLSRVRRVTAETQPVDQPSPEAAAHDYAPLFPVFPEIPNGPDIPLGDWVIRSTGAGSQSIAALQDTPDGRLFAAVDGSGLRVFAPDAQGEYSWSTLQASPGGLASNNVTDLAYREGALWVATGDAGLSILVLETQVWHTLNTSNSPLPSNVIRQLSLAPQDSGPPAVWLATNAGAVYYQPGPPATWQVYTTGNSGLISNNVNDIAGFTSFGLQIAWIATENGVSVLTGSSWSVPSGSLDCPLGIVRRVLRDDSGAIWLTPMKVVPNAPAVPEAPQAIIPLGVCRYLAGAWQAFNRTNFLPSNAVTDLSVDSAGRVWMSLKRDELNNQGGGAVFDQGTWLLFQSPQSPLAAESAQRVLAVGEAAWFGHLNLPAFSVYAPNWQRFPNSETGGSGSTGAILIESAQTWVGLGSALAWRDNAAWHTLAIPGNASPVTALARDSDGRLWIGTRNNGLFCYNGAQFLHFLTSDGLPSSQIHDLLHDALGRVWVATDGGLALFSGANWISFTSANSGLASDNLRALAEDSSGRLWIGTAGAGISLFEPANGANAWSVQTTANGLPSNQLRDLALDPSGKVWAATQAGLAVASAPGAWTVYTLAGGALPSLDVLRVASDPQGRIWAGTTGGLALYNGSAWRHLHLTGSLLAREQVTALAADDKHLWSAAGSEIAVRGIPSGPIGVIPPVITSFNPTAAPPFTQVTINGSGFDDRGPEFNQVQFGVLNGFLGATAKVLTASSTQLVVQVPLTAHSGHIQVQAFGLKHETGTDFIVLPFINKLNPACLGVGSLLKIEGWGFNGTSAQVQVGSGPWRSASAFNPTTVSTFILPGDTNGLVRVRITGGHTATYTNEDDSPAPINLGTLSVTGYQVQQAVQGMRMVWGKKTLVQLKLGINGGSCSVQVDHGKVEWKKKDGSLLPAGDLLKPGGGGVEISNGPGGRVSAVIEWDLLNGPFPLSQFDGVRFTLKNGPAVLLTYDIPASAFDYLDPPHYRDFLNVPIIPKTNYPDSQFLAFLAEIRSRLYDAGRVYPQQDSDVYSGWKSWLIISHTVFGTYASGIDLDDAFDYWRDRVDDLREFVNDEYDAGIEQALGVIAPELYILNTPSGKAVTSCSKVFSDCDRNTALAFVNPNTFVHTWLQEAIHALGWVQSWSINHSPSNPNHSRYDEGRWNTTKPCDASRTFRSALNDQSGFFADTWYLEASWGGGNPRRFPLTGCGNPLTLPKSAMSYAPNRLDESTFLEPIDYSKVLCHVMGWGNMFQMCGSFLIQGPSVLLEPFSFPGLPPDGPDALQYNQSVRLNGTVDPLGVVNIHMSYLLDAAGSLTPPDPEGDYHLLVRDAANSLLLDFPFSVGVESSHGEPLEAYPFTLRVGIPDDALHLEITHAGASLWTETISALPPVISVLTPGAGSAFVAPGPMVITWSATDPDSDALQFSIQYSPDDGATWLPVEPSILTANYYEWTIGFVPGARVGRIKVTASDGFRTTSAVSAPFGLTPRPPYGAILQPEDFHIYLEGQQIRLSGFSFSSNGPDATDFEWFFDGDPVGASQVLSYTLQSLGVHTVGLQVADSWGSHSSEVTILVLADYDRDGLPDDYELAHRMNPLAFEDAFLDLDGDLLLSWQEYEWGADPATRDTDGDGFSDGIEVVNGTDPLDPADFPASQVFLPLVGRQ